MSITLLSLLVCLTAVLLISFAPTSVVSTSSSSAPAAPSYTGVVASNNVASATGVSTWNVNAVASFQVGYRVQITWTSDSGDNMIGTITAVDPVGLTITVNVDTVNGPTGIPWSPWAFSLISIPSSSAVTIASVSSSAHSSSALAISSSLVSVSSSVTAPSFSGVIASNNVASATGTRTWNVNSIASFQVGYRVQITWTSDASDNMIGTITAVNATALTITVNVDTVNGPTGINWTPWAFSLISIPSSSSSVSVLAPSSSLLQSSSVKSSSVPSVSSSLAQSSSIAQSSSPLVQSSSIVQTPTFSGVIASNNVASALGVSTWNVNTIASYQVGYRVQITWTADSTDNMIGTITAINAAALTITVNVDTVNGPTGILWTPWAFSLISIPSSSASPSFASSSATAAIVASASITSESSSSTASLSYAGVISSTVTSSSFGLTTWNVNMIASYNVGDRVKIFWTEVPEDNMIGNITSIDSINNIIIVNVDTVNGPTGIQWSPWQFSLIAAAASSPQPSPTTAPTAAPSNNNPYSNSASPLAHGPSTAVIMTSIGLIALLSTSALLFV